MTHWITGTLRLTRPLAELATVFDMAGLDFSLEHDIALAHAPNIRLELIATQENAYELRSEISAGIESTRTLLTRLSLALEADGIEFQLELRQGPDSAPAGV